MPTYQKQLIQHLSQYRRERLGVAQSGTFRFRGVDRSYGHILPSELRWLNIPEAFRTEARQYVASRKEIRLHRYFHHLNSSQALALGAFYPFLTRNSAALGGALQVGAIRDWGFEEVPDKREGTNVDLRITGEDSTVWYAEVKLTEASFGGAAVDERHIRKLEKVYRSRLAGLIDSTLLEPRAFCESYQILRYLWHAARNANSRALFILPRANANLTVRLDNVVNMVAPQLQARIRTVYLEDLLHQLAAPTGRDDMSWYARILQEKYIPAVPA